jgi:L-ascorbate metabolism protein UlaG (beta-lactamase superfamily)
MFDPKKVGHDLDMARRTYGGRDWPESFADRLTAPLPSFGDAVRMMRTRGTPDLSVTIPTAIGTSLPEIRSGQSAVTWIGHASFIVRLGGLTILTDPVWSRRIPGVRERVSPPGLPFEALGPIDAVVISHNHYDHLDAPTIRRLPKDTPVFVPGMLGAWFRRRGFRTVVEMDWWESATIADVRLDFVPAHHWSRRGLGDTCKSLWGGWILRGPASSVYFAGDSGYGHWFAEIGSRYPELDVALLPVGAYEPNWFMKPVHMNPVEAVRAGIDVGARRMVPMHWGTFVLSGEPLLEPPEKARAAWIEAGRDPDDQWNLAIGESRSW